MNHSEISLLSGLAAAAVWLLCGCGHEPVQLFELQKTSWFREQVRLVNENNAYEISAALARQWIVTGRITKKVPEDTFLFSGKMPFEKNSIRFPDAATAAKVNIGDWFIARVQHDLKGRAPLVLDYRKLAMNTDSVPEEFRGDCEKMISLAVEKGWDLNIKVSDNRREVIISNGTPERPSFHSGSI